MALEGGDGAVAGAGGHDPHGIERSEPVWNATAVMPRGGWCVALAALAAAAILTLGDPPFSADSWSYLDLAQEVMTDFYHVDVVRQYQFEPGRGASFPPVWPLLIGTVLTVAPIGIYAGSFLNVLVVAATLPVLVRLGKAVCGWPAAGVMLFLGLLGNREYLMEAAAGRSIPLAVLLFLIALVVALTGRSPSREWIVGAAAGAVTLTRFDFLLGGLVLGLVVAVDASGRRLAALARCLTGYALALAPWIAYSLHHFGRFFISDNTRTVLLAEPSHVVNYLPDPRPIVFDAPVQWGAKTVANILFVCGIRLPLAVLSDRLCVLLVVFATVLALRRRSPACHEARAASVLPRLLPLGLAVLVMLLSVALTGYKPLRYHVLPLLFVDVCLLAFVHHRIQHRASIRIDQALIVGVLLVTVVPTLVLHVRQMGFKPITRLQSRLLANPEHVAAVAAIVEPERAKVLFLEPSGVLQSFEFGAQTGVDTFVDPRNLDERTISRFIDRYEITHVVTADPTWRDRLARLIGLELLDARLSLHRIDKRPWRGP